jgi:acyl-CoA dehydrogenase
VGPYIGELGTDEQKARWLPKCISGEHVLAVGITEPGAGSDVAGVKTKAEDMGDHFLLNGSKIYISNGILADLVVVVARTDQNSRHGLSLFVVERGMEGFERGDKLKKMGLKSQDTAELFFNNVKLPKENLLGEWNKGFYQLMHFQNTRFKMADMRMEIDVAQAFVDQCVVEHNDGVLSADDAAKAKLFTSELEGRVVDACVQLHGGAGYMDEYPICRMYLNARISRIYAGTSEIMREIIARSVGLDPRNKRRSSATAE